MSGYTAEHQPWEVIWYRGFPSEQVARDFERYLKGRLGRAFLRKRLVS